MYHNGIEVDILVNGKPIKKLAHDGKVFIEARHWTEYSIKIRNNHWTRRLVLVSVDGINVIDGTAAGESQAGYVINGYTATEIKGFRTSNEEVHPFRFNTKDQSYAATSEETQGDTRNCGVIGIQVYEEKVKPIPEIRIREVIREVPVIKEVPINPWPYLPVIVYGGNTRGTACGGGTYTASLSSFGGSNVTLKGLGDYAPMNEVRCCSLSSDMINEQPKRGFDMGTEFSDRTVSDKVVDVDFQIGTLATTIEIYYASKQGLESLGVPVTKQTQIFPSAFPNRFCKPPTR